MTDPLSVAVEYLRAVRSHGGTYAYRADEVGRWVVGVTESDVAALGRRLLRCPAHPQEWDETPAFAYSIWCAECASGEITDDAP